MKAEVKYGGAMSERARAWSEFMATECCICHAVKRPKNGFCAACYFSLPKAMQRPLWQTFGDGYEDAHKAAREWLENRRAQRQAAVTA